MRMIQPYRDEVQSWIDAFRESECAEDIALAENVAGGQVHEPVPDAIEVGEEEWSKFIGACRSLYDVEREEVERLRDECAD